MDLRIGRRTSNVGCNSEKFFALASDVRRQTSDRQKQLAFWLLAFCLIALLPGCGGKTTVKSTAFTPLEQQTTPLPENQLLDLGVLTFDPGLDIAAEQEDETVMPEVRNAEARYFANQLADTIQQSAAWGAVRVIPARQSIVDVYVEGTILHSDGEVLELAIKAWDTSGAPWLEKNYREQVSKYVYDRRRKINHDPFQGLFNRIANDLLTHRQGLTAEQASNLRTLSQLRFARFFAPDTYGDYLAEGTNGRLTIVRLPARDDTILQRIQNIRERDYLYIDTMQEYFDAFTRRMENHYQVWRAASYDEVVAARELKEQSKARLVGGIAAVAGGIVAAGSGSGSSQVGGIVAASGGGMLIKSALAKKAEAQIHVEALVELGQSLEAEIEPQVIELEDRTVTLSGNVQSQYDQWREILRQMYETERGGVE